MPRVSHFEIAADDVERANKFYKDVFGWEIHKWDGPIDYWLASTGDEDSPGIDGAIMKREDPNTSVVNTIDVSNLDKFMESVKSAGGSVISKKIVVPEVGYFAYCKDTEGNTFGIMEEDETAE